MKPTRIYSCFPGTGKTHFTNNAPDGLTVQDSDSSQFPKDGFPANYLEHIRSKIGKVDVLLVSSHQEVREAMAEAGIKYTLVYPDASLRPQYMARFFDRNNTFEFMKLIHQNWSGWLRDCVKDQGAVRHWVLKKGEYLSDRILGHLEMRGML